ncbi:DUF3108 domain-containing protein [Vogesella indigofera]|uniref:DUF3108 domain-containing protein n=1 Tax=Vogesella indigofera TaxID=45465 RepID=UPI00234E4306|nr:DUF3108 domain-containing protein [Vogesella indigofera]MDC7710289.1 DUF3108 domain-containing protein [Vogesella indigofera]
MMPARRRRWWPLLLALLASLLLHLLLFGGSLLSFDSGAPEDEAPLRKLTISLQAMAPAQDDASVPTAVALGMVAATADGEAGDASAPPAQAPRPAKRAKAKPAPAKPVAAPPGQSHATAPVASAGGGDSTAEASAPAAVASPGAEHSEPAAPKLARFPDAARLEYALLSSGLQLGRGEMNWQRSGGDYRIVTTVKPLIGPTLRYEVHGKVGRNGLQPQRFSASRNDAPREYARFDWAGGVLDYGDKEAKQAPLQPGALDWLSLAFELGLRGEQPGTATRQVTTGKKVYQFALQLAGETDFEAGGGTLRALVLRARNDKDLIEFWLAPDFANLPIRIMRVDNDKRFELRATLIEFNGAVVWTPPPPQRPNKDEN